mgnify:FL=1
MSKNRIKNLRSIKVDNIDYTWMYDGGIRIWKDKKIVYDGFPKPYMDASSATPGMIAKIVRVINGNEEEIGNEDQIYKIKNEGRCGMDYFSKYATFEDKKTEKLWFEFNSKYEELIKHLEKK